MKSCLGIFLHLFVDEHCNSHFDFTAPKNRLLGQLLSLHQEDLERRGGRFGVAN